MSDDLGKMPEPTTEEPQLHPGGVDSIDDPKYGTTPETPIPADANPKDNPAVSDVTPEELSQPENTDEPSSDGASDPESDAPA
ncbi:hypothetical protein [Nocardioides sp.]|uniref:hypothetical protein n=1 Tax=Nocardioides sp. TaxID=35761 RepID=UPI003D0DCDC5